MMKLIYRQYLAARFVGHGASVSDRTEGQADLDACIRIHNAQKSPSGLGYPNPSGMFRGDSA